VKNVDETPLAPSRWQGTGLALTLLLAACGDERAAPDVETASTASTATPAASTAQAPAVPRVPLTGTVTLITGDRVTLQPNASGDKPVPLVVPGPGRAKLAFATREHDGEVAVIPQDAAALIASARSGAVRGVAVDRRGLRR